MTNSNSFIILLFLISPILSCDINYETGIVINTDHLDYLYEEISVNGNEMAIIHIYSNYPNYEYLDDDDEGTACVDDAARGAIFYLNHYKYTGNKESLIKNKKLLKFIIYLQSENGYFYNFLWGDNTINKTFKTSTAIPNWWSWRALWALTESYPVYKISDPDFCSQLDGIIDNLIISIKAGMPRITDTEKIEGIELPTWLPYNYAADQASILLLGLLNYIEYKNDNEIKDYIELLRKGIIKMQVTDESNEYYGVFLSWQNTWHAWGNSQAFALLKSYEIMKDDYVLKAALKEVDNFYKVLLEKGHLNRFKLALNETGNIIITDEEKYPQIAYNVRPMVFALLEANKITNDPKYSILAGEIARWFIGENPASSKMYNYENGIVFDGIESKTKINMNSGAESTIEALLALQELSRNELSSSIYLKE